MASKEAMSGGQLYISASLWWNNARIKLDDLFPLNGSVRQAKAIQEFLSQEVGDFG
jgi:hypothetical protein